MFRTLIIHRGERIGIRDNWVTIETADGKKDVERSTPAGNPPERTTFLGTIHPDGSFTPAAHPATP